MKTLYFILILVSLFKIQSAQIPAYEGGKKPASFEPPKEVSEKFKSEYPEITATWHVEQKYYIADFTDTTTFKGISIVYDKNGKVVRRESEMENSKYPQGINDYYVKNYPGEKFKTYRSTDDKGTQSYCIKRQEGALWFDNEGNYMDPEKKNDQTASSN